MVGKAFGGRKLVVSEIGRKKKEIVGKEESLYTQNPPRVMRNLASASRVKAA